MINAIDVDVVIGGGGVAGAVTAMALQSLGYQVLVVEPGLNDDRRLAGELLHPPGVAGLAELGVLNSLMGEPAVVVNGFCILSRAGKECIKLPYDVVPSHRMSGLSLDHGLIRERLMQSVRELPGVTVVDDARVIGVDQNQSTHVNVQVAAGEAVTCYRSRLLVAADGASSPIRRLAGIGVHKRRISTIFGYRVPAANLPERDYGFVFLDGCTPILVYPVGGDEARVMFDIPYDANHRPSSADCLKLTAALPPDLRRDVDRAIATQRGTSALIQEVIADRFTRGRVALIGDAAATCHPLTATGMTMCITDALLLRDAIDSRPDDLRQALHLHQRRRRWRQITRLSLAEALRDVFCGESSEMRLVRRGIMDYWRHSSAGRKASMALLSTADGRLITLICQFLLVVVHGILAEARDPVETAKDRSHGADHSIRGLLRVLAHQLWQVLGKCRTILAWSASGA
jgi:2-polyprenyl-6-methoxyphenol hydroxylase-like FAD-dependent oxidoreductase